MIRADLATAPRAHPHAADDALDTKPGLARARSSSPTPKLTRSERVILRVLEYRMNGKDFAFPSQKLLAKDADYSPRAVKSAIAGLQRKRKLVVKRVADLTEEERALVEAASPRVVRNWRNNVYFRFDAQGIVRGKEDPRSGAIAARDTSLLDGKDQDRKPHHHTGSDLDEDPRPMRSVVVDDPIAERACRRIVAGWPTKLRCGLDERLATIALRRRFSEGMTVHDALEAIEGATLEADRLIRDARTTPFVLVFGRCDAWRPFAEAAEGARAARKRREIAERERRAADVELEGRRLSPRENAEAARALLAVLERSRGEVTRSMASEPATTSALASPPDDARGAQPCDR
jgi:hypothetical protein